MKIAFAAGGTAGHLYPALFTARELERRDPGFAAVFFVSRKGREREILSGTPFRIEELDVSGFGGGMSPGMLPATVRLLGAYRKCRKLLRRAAMQAVVGFGAYVSVAPVLAMRAAGGKVILHEQNAVMGKANRCLLPLSHAVAAGFPIPAERGRGRDIRFVGTPARPGLLEGMPCAKARDYLGLERNVFTVLVMGGSQGARSLNSLAVAAAPLLARAGGLQVLHLSGGRDYGEILAGYAGAGVRASVFPYLKEMQWAYAAADLAVCRCGAMTLTELALAGLPSVLVPLPGAADDHQRANAGLFERAGAAIVRREAALDAVDLAEDVLAMREGRDKLGLMGAAARSLARPTAAGDLADLIQRTVGRDESLVTRGSMPDAG